MRHRRLLWLWSVGLGFLGLAAGVWLAWSGTLRMPSRAVLIIPKGTQASLKAGQGLEAIPRRIQLRVGDIFVLRNEDITSHRVGGFYVRPGETLSYRFSQAGVFDYACTIHPDGQTTFQVDARPSPAVLWWTEVGLLGVLVGLSGLLLGAWSTRLGTGALAAGSATAVLGFFLMINSSDLRPQRQVVPENRPLPGVKSTELGQRLYLRLCEVCHGASGRGDGPLASSLIPRPANLIVHVPLHSDQVLFRYIHDGIPGTRMPALGESLTEQEIWHLVNYIKTMAPPPARSRKVGRKRIRRRK